MEGDKGDTTDCLKLLNTFINSCPIYGSSSLLDIKGTRESLVEGRMLLICGDITAGSGLANNVRFGEATDDGGCQCRNIGGAAISMRREGDVWCLQGRASTEIDTLTIGIDVGHEITRSLNGRRFPRVLAISQVVSKTVEVKTMDREATDCPLVGG